MTGCRRQASSQSEATRIAPEVCTRWKDTAAGHGTPSPPRMDTLWGPRAGPERAQLAAARHHLRVIEAAHACYLHVQPPRAQEHGDGRACDVNQRELPLHAAFSGAIVYSYSLSRAFKIEAFISLARARAPRTTHASSQPCY